MAISRFSNSRLTQSLPKYTQFWDQVSYNSVFADFLVVAGGGGGGDWAGGGGGAGGLRSSVGSTGGGGSLESRIQLLYGQTYTITVGSGGIGADAGLQNQASGQNSSISGSKLTTITCIGGGYGGGANGSTKEPAEGGSGGGGGGYAPIYAGSFGTANQGYDGGTGLFSTGYNGGGGGGAGGIGGNAGSGVAGSGGSGLSISITGSSVTYAVGGTGGRASAGGSSSAGASASANTGSGGDGPLQTNSNATSFASGAGGSGVVILRVSDSFTAASTTGSPTVTTSGGYRIYKFTGNGSITF